MKKKSFIIIILGILFFVLIIFSFLFFVFPRVIEVAPRSESQNVRVDSEIEISFSRPVNRDILIPSIEPQVPGEWKYKDPFFAVPEFFQGFCPESFLSKHFYKTLVFIPEQVLMPETKYNIELKSIKRVLGIGGSRDFSFGFATQTLPKVAGVEPEQGSQNILPSAKIKVKLTQPNPELVDFDFIFNPGIEFDAELNELEDEYVISAKDGFSQGVKYDLKVMGTFVVKDKETGEVIFQDVPKELYNGSFETAPPPEISSFQPTGNNILTSRDIKIVFSDSMDRSSVEERFSIDPVVEGDFTWSEDNKTLIFSPLSNLSYDTNFNVNIEKGALNENEGYLSDSAGFSFTTIGRVWISFSPCNGDSGVSVGSSIKVYFNQAIDEQSAKEHFVIEPDVSGDFSFSGNTMTFQPASSFSYQTSYKITLLSGVKSIYGLDSGKSFSTAFTTELETVKLSAPMDFQDYPLSCEAAALKMALAVKGVYVSEDQIMSYVSIDSSPRENNIWGDPYNIYVGNISGKQNTTGYGVYWDPIAMAARVWRGGSQSFTGWSISDLTTEIKNGNPVVVWGVTGSGAYEDCWYTEGGKYIYAWKGEHTRTAIGFVGNPNSPSKIILNDPWHGQIYWSTATFSSNWNIFGRSGVVVK